VEKPDTLTVLEVAAIARVSKATVNKWINGVLPNTEKLPAARIGRKWIIQRANLMKFLEKSA
jgi:excisionase family DNA binding protein